MCIPVVRGRAAALPPAPTASQAAAPAAKASSPAEASVHCSDRQQIEQYERKDCARPRFFASRLLQNERISGYPDKFARSDRAILANSVYLFSNQPLRL